jgi:glycosyltransferase involved in cell wall biosynthesis
LFIAPVEPSATGSGPAMRAWLFLEALSRSHEVQVLVGADAVPSGDFELVHVMRLYLAPLAEPFLSARTRPLLSIDVDDDDATVFADLGHSAEAQRFDRLAAAYLPRFDLVVTASANDPPRLAERYGLRNVVAVQNAVSPPTVERRSDGRTLLFVGDLGYRPNVDAAVFLCREVLPLVPDAHALVVGARPAPDVLALAGPRVEIQANVPDVSPYYARAAVAVVPLFAGGGSRTKIVEAFAHRVPVVSTAVGVAGLDADHLVRIAETPDEFARAIASEDGGLVEEAHRAYEERFTVDVVATQIDALLHAQQRVAREAERPAQREGLEINEVADGSVVYDAEIDRIHYLNGTAAVVFELCTGETTIDEMTELLQRAYDLPEPPRDETVACLGRLREEGLIL